MWIAGSHINEAYAHTHKSASRRPANACARIASRSSCERRQLSPSPCSRALRSHSSYFARVIRKTDFSGSMIFPERCGTYENASRHVALPKPICNIPSKPTQSYHHPCPQRNPSSPPNHALRAIHSPHMRRLMLTSRSCTIGGYNRESKAHTDVGIAHRRRPWRDGSQRTKRPDEATCLLHQPD